MLIFYLELVKGVHLCGRRKKKSYDFLYVLLLVRKCVRVSNTERERGRERQQF